MRKSAISLFMVLAIVAVAAVANANEIAVKAGGSSVCENASWIVYNNSEQQSTEIVFNVGPIGYGWGKPMKRQLAPGGYQAGAIAMKTTFKNNGPGEISVNCQRQRTDRHDWKIDAGAGKTYQSDYHMDHVRPQTYIEPGLGMEEGHERGLFSQRGANTGGAVSEGAR